METSSSTKSRKESPGLGTLILRAIVRLALVLMVGICLGVVLYFGGLILYQRLVLQPAGSQAARLDDLEGRLSLQQTQEAERLDQYNQRLLSLEEDSAGMGEDISALQGDMQQVETSLEEVTQNLGRLDDMQEDLDALTQQNVQTTQSIGSIEDTLEAGDTPLAELQREVKVLRAMELLNRSRLYLMQNNPGLAGEDMENARQTLEELYTITPEAQQPLVDGWMQRIDLALANLPYSPVLASDDLEIAWRMLVEGFAGEAADSAGVQAVFPTPFPSTLTPTSTPLPTHTPWVTPTP